ncbi:MAG: gamma-glutamylcyclotransferase [Polaromonas sp.]|nr:gamma-glutamylcyclotransferase [Polaromonas sp.]
MPPPTTEALHHVFVYGTLRRGEMRDINLLRPAPQWVGHGQVTGTLYDLGHYPGVVLGEGADHHTVHGEVYAIGAELERLLDEIEEVWPQQTGEYSKRELEVRVDAGGASIQGAMVACRLRCLVYEIEASRTHGKPVITGGDWVRYRQAMAAAPEGGLHFT